MKKLLIVANMPSANTRLLADAVLRGASHPDVEGVTPVLRSPLETDAEDVLSSDGIIIGTTENFAYMSGLIKDFFERIYYPAWRRSRVCRMPCTFAQAMMVQAHAWQSIK